MLRLTVLIAGLCAAPILATAQGAATSALTASEDAAVARAGRLVADGQGIAGRALIDTVLALAPTGSARYAELLFWRAAYAATAAEAERDYRRLAVEFPLSPRAEDALVALAQLEMARGDRELALRHLERLTLEHPTGAARVKAGYWAARIYFDMNDSQRACVVLQAARAAAADQPQQAGADLARRIDAEMQKCPRSSALGTRQSALGGALDSGARVDSASAPVASVSPPPSPARDSSPSGPRTTTTTTAVATGAVVAPDTSAPRALSSATPAVAAPLPARAQQADSQPRATGPAAPGRVPSAESRAPRSYSIQIAAFDGERDAETSVARLRARGLDARVDIEGGMFKVRVGRYATSAAAAAALREVKAKGMKDAWVVSPSSGAR